MVPLDVINCDFVSGLNWESTLHFRSWHFQFFMTRYPTIFSVILVNNIVIVILMFQVQSVFVWRLLLQYRELNEYLVAILNAFALPTLEIIWFLDYVILHCRFYFMALVNCQRKLSSQNKRNWMGNFFTPDAKHVSFKMCVKNHVTLSKHNISLRGYACLARNHKSLANILRESLK